VIEVKYLDKARLIGDFSFLTGVPVFSKDSGMWFREYQGSMYSGSTAAKTRMPLSLFIQLIYLGRIIPCTSMPDNVLKTLVEEEYQEQLDIARLASKYDN
jgi:hypothetical protein